MTINNDQQGQTDQSTRLARLTLKFVLGDAHRFRHSKGRFALTQREYDLLAAADTPIEGAPDHPRTSLARLTNIIPVALFEISPVEETAR